MSLPAWAERTQEEEEAELEADMEAARARIREKHRRRDIDFPAPTPSPVYVDVQPCPRCPEADEELPKKKKKSTFYAEPRLGWTLLGGRSTGYAQLSIGGLIRERFQLGAILSATGQQNTWVATGGIDTTFFFISGRFFRLGGGSSVQVGAYGLQRDGGIEVSSVFAVEPHATAEFRPLKWLAIGIDGGYRFAWSHPRATLGYSALSGPFAGAFVRFGL